MTLVVDASVALKWVLEEEGSVEAEALFRAERLIAPDFLLVECANVLAQKERRGLVEAEDAAARVREIAAASVQFKPTRGLVQEAHRLAVVLRQSAYDCLYLALAVAESAPLVTADIRFIAAASTIHPSLVRPLSSSS